MGALALALALPLTVLADEHDGDMTWRASGLSHFQSGVMENARVDANEKLIIAQAVGGFYLPQGTFISPFQKMPRKWNAAQIGYGFEIGPEGEIEVQVRGVGAEDGTNSRWIRVDPEDEIMFPVAYRYMQYRVRLYTSNPEETPRFDFFYAQMVYIPNGTGQGDGTGGGANVAKPPVVSRSAWGAKPPRSPYSKHAVQHIVVHHTSLPRAADYQGAATVRGIQHYHQNSRGWKDIGYHFLVGPDGKIFQGRPETVSGAHVIPNNGKVGVCVIGDFENGQDTVTPVQREAVVGILTWLAGTYGVTPSSEIFGHRDWMSTDCPGQTLYEDLPNIRQEVADALAAAGGQDPGTGPGASWLE